jgi:signal transduction histidine kinase
MVTLIAQLASNSPRTIRLLRLAAVAIVLSVISGIASAHVTAVDHRAFAQIIDGAGALFPTRSWHDAAAGAGRLLWSSAWQWLGLLLFSAASIWSGYKQHSFAALVVPAQLIVCGCIYGWVGWQLCGVEGQPVTFATAIVCGCAAGWAVRRRDQAKSELEAKNIELKLRNQELHESRLALVKQDEAERRLLAADLHDQILNDLRLVLKRVEQPELNPQERQFVCDQLKDTMNDVREIMDDLCPVMLEQFGLAAAIEDRLDKASKVANLDVRFVSSVDEKLLSQSLSGVELQLLYRLVQESITNVCKHAEAKRLSVNMGMEDDRLSISITDDGKGIDRSKLNTSSRGARYMRLRAALIGADVQWKNGADGKGTEVKISRHIG